MIGSVPSSLIESCPSAQITAQAVQAPGCFGPSALPEKSPTKKGSGPSGQYGPSRLRLALGGMASGGGGAKHGRALAWPRAHQLQRAWTTWTAWTTLRFQRLARRIAGTCLRTAWTGQDRHDSIIGFSPRGHPRERGPPDRLTAAKSKLRAKGGSVVPPSAPPLPEGPKAKMGHTQSQHGKPRNDRRTQTTLPAWRPKGRRP